MTGAMCLPAASVAKADVANNAELHDTVLARLSHELRTPLNSVIGFSRVLQDNRKGNQQPADIAMLEAIRLSGERLLVLVEDLMALAARGAVTLHTQKYKLDDFQQAISDLDAGKVRGRAILVP